MSEYREKLQKMMLKSCKVEKLKSSNLSTFQPFNFSTFYTVCEAVGYATLVAAYLLIIAAHI